MKKLYILLVLLTISISCWSSTAPPKGYFDKVNELLEKQIAENNRLLEEGRSEEMNFVVDAYPLFNTEKRIFERENATYSLLSQSDYEGLNEKLLLYRSQSKYEVDPYLVLTPALPAKLIDKISNDEISAELSNPKHYRAIIGNTHDDIVTNSKSISVVTLTGRILFTTDNKVKVIPTVLFGASRAYIEAVGLPEHELVTYAEEQLGLFVGNLSTPHQLVNRLVDNYGSFLKEEPLLDCHELITKLQRDPRYNSFFVEGSTLNTAIQNNPCILKGMYSTGEGLGYTTEFWAGIENIFGTLTEGSAILVFSAMVGPAVIELGLPYVLQGGTSITEWVATQEGRKILKDELEEAVKNIAVEIGVQMAFNMILEPFFSEEPVADLTFQKVAEASWTKIDWSGVALAPATYKLGKKGLVIDVLSGCGSSFISELTDGGKQLTLNENFSSTNVAIGCLLSTAISTTTYFVSKKIDQRKKAQLTKFVTEIGEVSEGGFTKADRFFSICRKLGLTDADKEVVESFLKAVGVGEDKGFIFTLWVTSCTRHISLQKLFLD